MVNGHNFDYNFCFLSVRATIYRNTEQAVLNTEVFCETSIIWKWDKYVIKGILLMVVQWPQLPRILTMNMTGWLITNE